MSFDSQQTVFWFLMVIAFVFVAFSAKAQVMQSNNFQIQSDSINFGGGLSTSTNYSLQSTIGETATGNATSTNFNLYAGYQQMQEIYLSLSAPGTVTMSPSIPGITGGESNGSTTVTVITDNPAGYQLTIISSDNPAMQSSNSLIPDYVPSGGNPDYSFNYGATEAFFGFSPSGADTIARFLDNGSTLCGTGSIEGAQTCWDGLSSTTAMVIAAGTSANHPLGATTSINFRVGVGSAVGQTQGQYVATTTITVLAL